MKEGEKLQKAGFFFRDARAAEREIWVKRGVSFENVGRQKLRRLQENALEGRYPRPEIGAKVANYERKE